LAPYALEAKDVRDVYRATVDTSGKPVQAIEISSMFKHLVPSLPSKWWCPGGNCSSSGGNQGISPLEQWSSPYG